MKRCKHCGRLISNVCLDCHYRNGGRFQEGESNNTRQLGQVFASHSRTMFRSAFTADQLQQVSPSER